MYPFLITVSGAFWIVLGVFLLHNSGRPPGRHGGAGQFAAALTVCSIGFIGTAIFFTMLFK